MPEWGDVVFNLTGVNVARLLTGNLYGLAGSLEYGQELSFSVISDNDELMSYGMIVERLAIPKKIEGTIKQGAIDFLPLATMTGFAPASSGTTPNRTRVVDVLAGGSGLPYFGLIGAFAGTFGANTLCGFPKAQLDSFPSWEVEANKFRIGETKFTAMAIETTTRKLLRIRSYETAAAVPTDFANWFSFVAA